MRALHAPPCSLPTFSEFFLQCSRLNFHFHSWVRFASAHFLFSESGLFTSSLLCRNFVFYPMIKIPPMAFSLLAQINGVFDVLFCLRCSSVSFLSSMNLIKSNQMLTHNYSYSFQMSKYTMFYLLQLK